VQQTPPPAWTGHPPQQTPQQPAYRGVDAPDQAQQAAAQFVALAGASSDPPDYTGSGEQEVDDRPLWEYKVISSTFGTSLEGELNVWGASGWEVISIAGMNGTVTITGNKMFVVLKRRSRAVEAVVSAASDYLGELRGYYGPAFDQVKQPLW
jgi:hypothetical protein